MSKISEAHFNPETYMVIDKISGEEVPIQIFIEHSGKDYWEKAYAKTVAEYIGIGGNNTCTVLAYLITQKNSKNIINGTLRELAGKMGVNFATVSRTVNALRERGLVKKIRNGCYFLSPKLMRYGDKVHGAMLLRLWIKAK